MALHLIKMAVGAADFDELRRFQKQRRKERGRCCFFTRNMPRRVEEVLDGGSIYWVIKGQVQARQRLLGFTPTVSEDGKRYCIVEYDKELVPVLWQPKRPFQGWRYLEGNGQEVAQRQESHQPTVVGGLVQAFVLHSHASARE